MRGVALARATLPCFLLAVLLGALPAQARNRGADGEFSERRSQHFVLLQDVAIDGYTGPQGSRRFERDVLATLENAYDQVRAVLGVGPSSPVQVLIYDPTIFDREFRSLFRFRAAGFFNGVIHVRGSTALDRGLVGTLHHEYLHAALAALAGNGFFPGWLNEGLAEYFERLALGVRHLTPAEHAALRNAASARAWIPISRLSSPSFQGLAGATAGQAYLQSYALVEYMVRHWDERTMRRFCEQLVRSGSQPRALQRVYRTDLAGLEAGLLEELR